MRISFLFSFYMMAIISCNTVKTAGSIAEKPASLDGSWALQMLFATDNNWARVPALNLNFNERTFTGNTGCNSIRGKFEVKDSYIEFDKNIASTKMACPGSYEQTFLSALSKVNKFTVLKEMLELSQGEIVLMKFKKSQVRLP